MGKYLDWIKRNILNEKEVVKPKETEEKEEENNGKSEKSKENQIAVRKEPKERIYISHMDVYFWEAGRFVIEENKGSIGLIQRKFKLGFNRVSRIMDELYEAGIVGEELGTKPREILMSLEEFEELLYEDSIIEKEIFGVNKESKNLSFAQMDRVNMYNNQFDYMEGHDFEYFCARL